MESNTPHELRKVLSDMFHLYFRAHVFHWNVTGILFDQYHTFFGRIYNETWIEIDPIAEHIRGCGVLAPASVHSLATTMSDTTPGTVAEMVNELVELNEVLLSSLRECRKVAIEQNYYGVVNYVEGLIDKHDKLAWQLKSSIPN